MPPLGMPRKVSSKSFVHVPCPLSSSHQLQQLPASSVSAAAQARAMRAEQIHRVGAGRHAFKGENIHRSATSIYAKLALCAPKQGRA